MRIGIDLDNTLAGYDSVFPEAARERGLLPEGFRGGKAEVRNLVRGLADGERQWQALQGRAYGALMSRARLIDGAAEFLLQARAKGAELCIVSHKTEYGHFDPERINLRQAAWTWLMNNGFFAPDSFRLNMEEIYFESTRADKIARITALDLTHFIDDLPDLFEDPTFPEGPERLLLALQGAPASPRYRAYAGWPAITEAVFGATALRRSSRAPADSLGPRETR